MDTTQPDSQQRIAGITKEQFIEKNAANAGRLIICSLCDVDVILRPMTRAEYDKFLQDGQRARSQGTSMALLYANTVRASLIAPSTAEFDAALERYPAIGEGFTEELLKVAGADAKVQHKTFL